jgi:DNA-binding NarL/FixJ family response regulator
MGDKHRGCVTTQRAETRTLHQDVATPLAVKDGPGTSDAFIAVIESRMFVGECIRRGIQSGFSSQVVAYSTLSEFEHRPRGISPGLVLLSLTDAGARGCASSLKALLDLVPGSPIVVLGLADSLEVARIAIHSGARGYIPCTMGFEIAVEALRFILAGGTYVPTDFLFATSQPQRGTSQTSSATINLTRRELEVVRAIQQGKSNKVIANELTIRDSTVKIHLRNLMKKMRAKNRTEVAIKAQSILNTTGATVYVDTADQAA